MIWNYLNYNNNYNLLLFIIITVVALLCSCVVYVDFFLKKI